MTDDVKPAAQDMGPQMVGSLSVEDSRLVRSRQAGRARAMAVVLFGLCVLFFAITVVKVGVWG